MTAHQSLHFVEEFAEVQEQCSVTELAMPKFVKIRLDINSQPVFFEQAPRGEQIMKLRPETFDSLDGVIAALINPTVERHRRE